MAAGTISTSAAELFATPSADRTEVEITNCEDPDTNPGKIIYVWFANTVSSTVWCERLESGSSRQFDIQDQTDVWIVGNAANIHYTAAEKG